MRSRHRTRLGGRRWLALIALAVGCAGSPGAEPAAAPAPEVEPAEQQAGSDPADSPSATEAPSSNAADGAGGQAAAGASPDEGAAKPPAEPPPIPEGATVLHIGDSMAGALGIELNKALRAAGVNAILRFKTASFIPNWAGGSDLPVLMERYDPDLTLISLGANEVQIKDPSIRTNAIRKIVSRIGGRPCVWIAPPLWKAGDTGLLPLIRENCAPCRYMDTNTLVKNMPRVSDKIHPSMAARPVWAKFVVEWLMRERDPSGPGRWSLRPERPGNPGPILDFDKLAGDGGA